MYRLLLALVLLTGSNHLLADRLSEAAFSGTQDVYGSTVALKNQAVLDYLWVDVYAAAFYAPPTLTPRQAIAQQSPLRLELYYFRSIKRSDVIKAAWITLKRQHEPARLGPLRRDIDALHAAFRDIQPGDRYALNYSAEDGLSLQRNDETLYQNANPELARAYLGIWLAENGLSDTLRKQLLAAP
ncbi:chalcone isomerase family protein [Pseudomonas sp. Marseille-Q8238]